MEAGTINLSDRRRGCSIWIELGKQVLDSVAEVVLDHLAHLFEGDLRRMSSELTQLGLKLLLFIGRQAPQIPDRSHLSDLHGRAFHLPEHLDDVAGGLEASEYVGIAPVLRRSPEVGRPGGVRPGDLATEQANDLGRAPEASGRD
jgi:hypothetical protein